jgi:hypothetical protein
LNIVFLTGKYRPGKCGISDYVQLLSNKIVKVNYSIKIDIFELPNYFKNPSLSIPVADFYILQYSPFAFASKGTVGKPLINLSDFLNSKNIFVNFHEIWIGDYKKANLKEKILGWFQKREIIRFLRTTNPNLITTSNAASLARLKKGGFEVKLLYLFGNIPYYSAHPITVKQNIKVAFFGTPYEKFPYELLAERLRSITKLSGKSIELRIIGRQREEIGLQKIRKIAKKYQFTISETGNLSPERLSIELQDCSFGVSTTPYDILGKSGATSAMLEHGLSLLTYDDGDTQKESLFVFAPFNDQIFLINEPFEASKLIEFMKMKRKPFFDGVAYTAKRMVEMVA